MIIGSRSSRVTRNDANTKMTTNRWRSNRRPRMLLLLLLTKTMSMSMMPVLNRCVLLHFSFIRQRSFSPVLVLMMSSDLSPPVVRFSLRFERQWQRRLGVVVLGAAVLLMLLRRRMESL